MAQIEDIRKIQGIDPILEETRSQIESADPALAPDDPDSVRSVLKNALTRLKDQVDGHNLETRHEIETGQIGELKVQAEDGFFSAREKLSQANSSFYASDKLDAALITEVLLGYASGYHLYTQFCSGGDAVDIVERWNAVNEGNQVNCPQMVTSQGAFMQLVDTGLAPHTVTGDETRSFFETLQDRGFLRFGPQVFYQRNKERFYRGVGIYGEGVVSVKEDSPWFAGALLQINGQNSYDGRRESPFKGELKTTEWSVMPPLLEAGHQAPWWSASILAGGWFTAPLVADSERENVSYADNLFKNPNFLAGIRGTLLDHRLGLGVDYSYTPWGSQYAFTTDVDLNFWRSQ